MNILNTPSNEYDALSQTKWANSNKTIKIHFSQMFTSHQRRKKKKKKSCKRSYLVNVTALLHLNNLRENTMLRKYYQGIKMLFMLEKCGQFALLQPPCPYLFTSNSFSMISHIFNLIGCTVFSGYWDEISYCFHHILVCLFFSPQLFFIYPWLKYFLSFCFI